MTNIILGLLFVLFLFCIYKIANLREKLDKQSNKIDVIGDKAKEADFIMAKSVDNYGSQLRMLDKQLMALRVEYNEFIYHYESVSNDKVNKLIKKKLSKKPAKKKAYVKKTK